MPLQVESLPLSGGDVTIRKRYLTFFYCLVPSSEQPDTQAAETDGSAAGADIPVAVKHSLVCLIAENTETEDIEL